MYETIFEKVFDSMNHNFFIAILEKYGVSETSLDWIKILLTNQESCVIKMEATQQNI